MLIETARMKEKV